MSILCIALICCLVLNFIMLGVNAYRNSLEGMFISSIGIVFSVVGIIFALN